MENIKTERALTFTYCDDEKIKRDLLVEKLKQNNLEFIATECQSYWGSYFVILKTGKKWNDIMKLVNSVRAPKYTYKTITYINELWDCGTIREVCVF